MAVAPDYNHCIGPMSAKVNYQPAEDGEYVGAFAPSARFQYSHYQFPRKSFVYVQWHVAGIAIIRVKKPQFLLTVK